MKKGQVYMTETIGVLFIFFILVLFGFIFYFNYQKIAIKERQEELLGARAIDITTKAIFLPELYCSRGDAEAESFCIDLLKVRSLTERQQPYFLQHLEYYFQIFGYANITIHQLSPEPSVWVLYDKPKTKKLEDGTTVPDWTAKEPTYFVVTLRDEAAGSYGQTQYGFGYIQVEVYS